MREGIISWEILSHRSVSISVDYVVWQCLKIAIAPLLFLLLFFLFYFFSFFFFFSLFRSLEFSLSSPHSTTPFFFIDLYFPSSPPPSISSYSPFTLASLSSFFLFPHLPPLILSFLLSFSIFIFSFFLLSFFHPLFPYSIRLWIYFLCPFIDSFVPFFIHSFIDSLLPLTLITLDGYSYWRHCCNCH